MERPNIEYCELLEELISQRKTIEEQMDGVAVSSTEYARLSTAYEEVLAKISQIMERKLNVPLSEIKENFNSEMDYIPADKISVQLISTTKDRETNFGDAMLRADRFNTTKDTSTKSITLTFRFSYKDENGPQREYVKVTMPLNSIQKDGKTLGEHCHAEVAVVNKEEAIGSVKVEIDDLDQLILPFVFDDLIEVDRLDNVSPTYKIGYAVMFADDKCKMRSQDTVM